MTTPGFSSRQSATVVPQFPMRDEAVMSVDPGFSNSDAAKHAPDDVHPDVQVDTLTGEPGWANTKADKATADAEAKVVSSATTEDKAVKTTARRAKKKS
jgi:hypothetical protein